MGSWAPPMGLIPASHFPIPFSVTFSANKPLCPQILVSEQASRDPNPRHGEHSKAPPQGLGSASLTQLWLLQRACLDTACPALLDPESWAQFLLQVTYLPENLPSPRVLGQKKMPPESKLNPSHQQLRPRGSQEYPEPLPAFLRLTAPSPHLSPGLTTRLPESAPPFCSWYKESVPTRD